MTVFINLLSLICHTCLILSALWYKHALGTHISLLYFLTGTILVNTVAYLSGAEAVLAFLGLFFDAWRWKLVFLIRICIVLTAALLLTYALLETIQDPTNPNLPYNQFHQAMERYSSDIHTKVVLDEIQMNLKCCGSRNYTDWYGVQWYAGKSTRVRPSSDEDDSKDQTSKKNLQDDVPFSCCSDSLAFPCIHFGVESTHPLFNYKPGQDLTLWKDGCGQVLTEAAIKLHRLLIQGLSFVIVMQVIQFVVSLNQYSNEKKSSRLNDIIANINMNDDEITEHVSGNEVKIQNQLNSTGSNQKKPQTAMESVQKEEHKSQVKSRPEKPVERKEVTFNEKENSIYENNNPWSQIQNLYTATPQHKVDTKNDVLTKSILKGKTPRSAPHQNETEYRTPEQTDLDHDSDVNITETLRDLKDKVVKKFRNKRKYYLSQPTSPSSGKTGQSTQPAYNRPLRYLSTKLRKIQQPSRKRKGGQTWSTLIANNLKRIKDQYTKEISGGGDAPDSVVVMNSGRGAEKYFSSTSDTESPRLSEKAQKNRDQTNTAGVKNARSKEPNVSKYFDTSPPDLMDKYHSKRGAAKLPEQGSGVSASTTGDELVRKYKREMSTPNAKNSKPQEGNNLTQHEVNFPQDLPMSTPSSSSLPNI
ncbi:uncharacterized protein LOC103513525 [Diaphorina citri]|uniref:Uncharacterized protein LOC103513525 n=1 Tax=Diaphorina citri TaxID=121845 RepID=A0A3Q0J1Y9_DIACI|nr:uncharacterized protein LOC103513525 [Diaphorina citri]